MSTIYIGVVGNSAKSADNWIEKFVQSASDKGIEYIGPASLPTRTINGKTYHGRRIQMEPAGRSIDFLDYELPPYVDVKIGIDSGEINTADLYQNSSIYDKTDTDSTEVIQKEDSKLENEKSGNLTTENGDLPGKTSEEEDSTSVDTNKAGTSNSDLTLEQLRDRAQDRAIEDVPEEKSISRSDTTQYTRLTEVRDYVKARADGSCEGCEEPAPFVSKTGDPYFHAHHIDELSNGGSDTPSTVIALCPNCHYRIHHGENGNEYNEHLREKLLEIESQ